MILLAAAASGQDPVEALAGHLQQGRLAEAEVLFQDAWSRLTDGAARNRFLRSVHGACRRDGRLGEFTAWLERSTGSRDPVALYYLAFTQIQLKLLQRAERNLHTALGLHPGSEVILGLQADLAFLRFEHERAASLAEQAGAGKAALKLEQHGLAQSLADGRVRQWIALLGGVLLIGVAVRVTLRVA